MFKYNIRIAFRNIIKYKTYFLINVSGLATGMAVCILLMLYVGNEFSYDRYNLNADNVYRLCQAEHPYHSPQTAKILADGIPEIKDYAQLLLMGTTIIQFEEKRFKESEIIMADPGLFRLFSFKFKYGGPETALRDPFSLVISEKTAHKYFGNVNPVGKVVRLDDEYDYTISAVIENMPQNSHFRYDIFITLVGTDEMFGDWINNWGWQNFAIYFLIPEDFSASGLTAKFSDLIVKHKGAVGPEDPEPEYVLQRLKDIHLHSAHLENDIQPQNSITYVLMFSAIGIFILLIACFNYINLLTANAVTRVKEIGIKKVAGASRRQLSGQFMGESFILLGISFFLSLILVEITLPGFTRLLGKDIPFSALFKPASLLGLAGIFLFTGILAGSYPAFFLSGLQPLEVMKGSTSGGHSYPYLRKILVVIQFIIVIALLSGAIVMFRQINYLENKDLGYDKENILVAGFEKTSDINKYLAFREALLSQQTILSVSEGSRIPSGDLNNMGTLSLPEQTKPVVLPFVHVGFDYFETLGIQAKQGRLFSEDIRTDMDDAIILNEAAVKLMGITGDPTGQSVECSWPASTREITGVVNDFHFESLYNKVQPVVFVPYYEQCRQLLIKIRTSDIDHTKGIIEKICNDYYPEEIFEFSLLDERLEAIYMPERNTFRMMSYFTAIAMLIACIGLLGLALFILKSRTKEIGLHKVFGSSISEVILRLSGTYAEWVVIACILGWPVAWYIMKKWLEGFAYRTGTGIWPFLVAGICTMMIALITVSWLSYRSARKNPADTLRYE